MKRWISGFLHTLLLRCLQERFNLERWVSRLFLRLDYSRFTHQQKRRLYSLFSIFLLSSLLVFGIKPILVLAETPTPSPTFENLWNTPTPKPTNYYTCNVDKNPTGYGTYTPDAYWLDKCQACITRTPLYTWPTSTPAPWETPQPTNTPASTSTPAPTATPNYSYISAKITTYNVGSPAPSMTYSSWEMTDNTYIPNSKNYTDYHNFYTENGVIKATGTSGYDIYIVADTNSSFPADGAYEDHYFQIKNENCGASTITMANDSYFSPGQTFNFRASAVTTWYWWQGVSGARSLTWGSKPIKFTVHCAASATDDKNDLTFKWYYGDVGWSGQTRSEQSRILVQRGGFRPASTPVPTATPNNSYCSAVIPQAQSQDVSSYFALPVPTLGWSQCVGFGGFLVPLGWVGSIGELIGATWTINDINFPQFSVCFRAIRFGSLNLFGINISLDILATVMAAVVAIRIITRS